jgi:hypothetical protein
VRIRELHIVRDASQKTDEEPDRQSHETSQTVAG